MGKSTLFTIEFLANSLLHGGHSRLHAFTKDTLGTHCVSGSILVAGDIVRS